MREPICIPERQRDQAQIDYQRGEREQYAHRIDQNEQGGEQRRPGDQRHPERHNSEFIAASVAGRPNIEQFAPCQGEQNKTAGDLKVCIGNSKRIENNLAKKNKSDRHAERCEKSETRLVFALFWRSARREPHEYRDESDWIDGDKDRNESDEKFLDHRCARSLACQCSKRNTGRLIKLAFYARPRMFADT